MADDPFADLGDLFESGDNREAVRAYGLAHAKRRGIDPDFADRLWTRESGYNRHALNKETGAAGIGQMIPGTQKRFGLRNPHDAREGIDKSLDYLETLHKEFGGDTRRMAAGYFAGEGQSDRALANPDGNPKTTAYANAVGGSGGHSKAFADIEDLLERGPAPAPRSKHSAAPTPAAPTGPTFQEDPFGEQQFEMFKRTGNLDTARQYATRLKAKGYEVGEDADGNPYQRRPSSAAPAPSTDRVLTPQRPVRSAKRSTMAQQFHGDPLHFWEEEKTNQNEMQAVANGQGPEPKTPGAPRRPTPSDPRAKVGEAGATFLSEPVASVGHVLNAPQALFKSTTPEMARIAAEQSDVDAEMKQLNSKIMQEDTTSGPDWDRYHELQVKRDDLAAQHELASRPEHGIGNPLLHASEALERRGLEPGLTKDLVKGAGGAAMALGVGAAAGPFAPAVLGGLHAAERVGQGSAVSKAIGEGVVSAGSMAAMGGAAHALDRTALGSLSKLAARSLANTGIGLGSTLVEGGDISVKTSEERQAFLSARIFDIGWALLHSPAGRGLTGKELIERAAEQAVSEPAQPESLRVRHNVFGEGTVSPDQRGVATGYKRVQFDDHVEPKVMRQAGKNPQIEPIARAAAPNDTQQGAPSVEEQRPSANDVAERAVIDRALEVGGEVPPDVLARHADYIAQRHAEIAANADPDSRKGPRRLPTPEERTAQIEGAQRGAQFVAESGGTRGPNQFVAKNAAGEVIWRGQAEDAEDAIKQAGPEARKALPQEEHEQREGVTGELENFKSAAEKAAPTLPSLQERVAQMREGIAAGEAKRVGQPVEPVEDDQAPPANDLLADLKKYQSPGGASVEERIASAEGAIKAKRMLIADWEKREVPEAQRRAVITSAEKAIADQQKVLEGLKAASPGTVHKFSSTQVDLPEEHAASVLEMGRSIPDKDLAADGREKSPHITVKYGLHTEDARKLQEALAGQGPITVTLGKTSTFKGVEDGTADAVIAEVDSPDLHRLNKMIADAEPHTDTHPDYKPHVTVAYVKPGLGEKYAGREDLVGKTITLKEITFSSKNGETATIPLGERGEEHPSHHQNREEETGRFAEGHTPEGHEARRARLYDRLTSTRRGESEPLHQASDLSIDEFRQVSKKADALKKQAKEEGRPLDIVVDEYLRQRSLFGSGEHELTPEQQDVLLGMAGVRKRRGSAGEQGALFETEPTLESKQAEAEQKRFNSPQGTLFQADGTADKSRFSDKESPDKALERLPLREGDEGVPFMLNGLVDREVRNQHPYVYRSKPGQTPPKGTQHVVVDDPSINGRVILTAEPLSPILLQESDMHPVNAAGRDALASEIAPHIAEHGGIIVGKPGTSRGVMITRSGKYKTGFQYTTFDDMGFSGDHDVKTLAEGLQEAARDGFTRRVSSEAFGAVLSSERFAAGDHLTQHLNKPDTPENRQRLEDAVSRLNATRENERTLFQADTPEGRDVVRDVVADFAKEGVRDFREAVRKFRDEFGPAEEYAKLFEEAWDAETGVKKRGTLTFERAIEDPRRKGPKPEQEMRLHEYVRRAGGLNPNEYSEIRELLSPKQLGTTGLMNEGQTKLKVHELKQQLIDEGWIPEMDDQEFIEAVRADYTGEHPVSHPQKAEADAQKAWEQAGRESFANDSDHSVMSAAFDNASAPEYKDWVNAYDTAVSPRGRPTDEDIQFFKEASRELGLSDETINRLLANADDGRRAETARLEGAERQSREGTTVPTDAASFQSALVDVWKISEAAAEATSHVVDAFANTWAKLTGNDSADFFKRFRIGADVPGMEQKSRAATNFLQDGSAVISALRNPNESSAAHEVHHVASALFMNLSEEMRSSGLRLSTEAKQFVRDMDTMSRWMGLKSVADFNALHEQYIGAGGLKGDALKRYVAAQEKGARGFERYLRDGQAPTPALESVFKRFKAWLSDIYFSLAGSPIDVNLSPGQRAVWDRLLGGEGDQDPKVTGIKNAVTDAERERRGQAQIEGALRKAFDRSLDDGKKIVEGDVAFRESVAKWAKDPKPLSDSEDAALTYDRMRLYNEHRQVLKQLEEVNNTAESEVDRKWEMDRLNLKLAATEELININDEAARRTGTENGRGLNARKLMINQDYSLASMLQRARVAEGEKKLSPELRKRVEDLHKRIASADAELELARQKISELESQNARNEKAQNWGKAISKGKPRAKAAVTSEMESVKAQFAELARKAKGLHQDDTVDESLMPKELQKLVKRFARLSVESGARTAEEVNELVHGMVSEHFPEITPRETADIWSEYGKKAVLSKDEIDAALREAKRQGRLLSGLEDALAGEPPQRSGLQRDKPSQRVRALTREVSQAIRQMGLRPERKVDPEEQWKTSQEAVRTRLRNHIEDLDHQIETGERPVAAPKFKKAYDDETIALMAERDVLKRQTEDPTAQNKEKLRAQLEETERKLAEKDLGRTGRQGYPPEIYDDAEGTSLRRQVKELQRQLNTARREPQLQDLLRNRISDLQRRIREGDFSRAAKEPVPVSPATEGLRAQRDALTKTLRDMEGPREVSYEQKLKAAEAGVQRSIDDLTERISKGQLESKKRDSSVWSAELGKLKSQREALSNTLKDMQKAAKAARDPQVAKLRAYKKAVEKSIAEYERRLAEGDFTTKQRSTLTLDAAAEALVAKRDAIKNHYQAELQKQKPGKWYRNAGGLRKAWMLSGPTTQLRNIGGTGLYQVFEEAARVPAAMTDVMVSAVTGQRSVTLSPIKTLDALVNGLGRKGLKEFKETIQHGATKEQMEQHQFFHEIDTGVKVVDVASNAVFRFMSASDRLFNGYAFRRNLADRALVQAKNEARLDKGLDVRKRAADLVERAESGKEPELKASAEHDALVATFNNNNALSTAMKSFKGRLTPGQLFALELVMPFDRTPTNVVLRVLEATPLGYLKAAKRGVSAIGRAVEGARENRSAEPDAKVTAREIIRQAMTVEQQRDFSRTVGKATAGSILMSLGYLLASKGMLTGAGSDEDKRNGIEPNTLTWRGHQLNLSPVSPLGNILALGASAYQWSHRGNYDVTQLVEAALNPITDQPLLRAGGQVSKLATNFKSEGSKQLSSMAFSFVPFSGMVRDIGKAHSLVTGHGEPKAKTSADVQGFKEQFQKNVPGWRNLLPPKHAKGGGALVPQSLQRTK